MGSAGHIDHGKTSLVKSLTGYNCDTHKEEQRRGITINLGFTYLKSNRGDLIGIIDVPGHSDFIHTMISGTAGIDFVMLVIAADSGVMPQTVEHLQIMELLGIRRGFVVITKIDLIDKDLLGIVKDEVVHFLKGSFLEGTDILEVSSKTNEGIESLKDYIFEFYDKTEERKAGSFFRYSIDRIFKVAGYGQVVTGTVRSGILEKNQNIYLLPPGKKLRVRKIERHKTDVLKVQAGDRASLNLVGLDNSDFYRGMVLCDRFFQSTNIIDAELKLISNAKPLSLWSHVIFLTGTFESQAKIHLIDKDNINPGQTALVQIHLAKPAIILNNDTFVIRATSSDLTYGGGKVIDAYPLHHRKRTQKIVESLSTISTGSLLDRISIEVKKQYHPVSLTQMSKLINIDIAEIEISVSKPLPGDIRLVTSRTESYFLQTEYYNMIKMRILRHLTTYHKNNPLDQYGRTFVELMGLFSKESEKTPVIEDVVKIILSNLEDDQELKKVDKTWTLFTHKVTIDEYLSKKTVFVEDFLLKSGLKVPLMSELEPASLKMNIDKKQLEQILKHLVQKGKVYNIEGNFIHSTIVDKCRAAIINFLRNDKNGITVAVFRDLIRGNRKICLLLLAQFDTEGTTIRKGDYRFLSSKVK